MKRKAVVRTYGKQLNSSHWWAYNNRGMALEDLAKTTGSHKDCGKVIDFTPPDSQPFNFNPSSFKSKTSQLTGAFLDMTEQFKQTLFRPR